jgi:hypothetical protein
MILVDLTWFSVVLDYFRWSHLTLTDSERFWVVLLSKRLSLGGLCSWCEEASTPFCWWKNRMFVTSVRTNITPIHHPRPLKLRKISPQTSCSAPSFTAYKLMVVVQCGFLSTCLARPGGQSEIPCQSIRNIRMYSRVARFSIQIHPSTVPILKYVQVYTYIIYIINNISIYIYVEVPGWNILIH